MDLFINKKYILKNFITLTRNRKYLFKRDVSEEIYYSIKEEDSEDPADKKRHLLCAECSQGITDDSERVEVNGSHEHTFVNPNGIVFQIGCFAGVFGVNISGHKEMRNMRRNQYIAKDTLSLLEYFLL